MLVVFAAILLVSSCKKDKEDDTIEDCGVENPIEELTWLKQLKDNCFAEPDCKSHFYSAVFDKKTVFYTDVEGLFCQPKFSVELRDCNNGIVKSYGEGDESKFNSEVTDTNLMYVCEE